MRYTENYNLKLPELEDKVDVEDLNYNTEFIDGKLKDLETNGSSGDMLKSEYDKNNNGKVDIAENSEKLQGKSLLQVEEVTREHERKNVANSEVHGLRTNDGYFEFWDGKEWKRLDGNTSPNQQKIYGFEVDETNINPKTAVTYIADNEGYAPIAKTENGDFDTTDWWEFIQEISYPVLLLNGVENYKLSYNDKTKKLDGGVSVLDGTDGDVMTFITHIWRKFEKTANGYRVYLSTKPFEGSIPWTQEIEDGYNQFNNRIMILLQDLYLLLFKDRDSQTALGRGFVDGNSDFARTGGTNGKGYIYGETTGKLQMCFLGIEDFWGNKNQWVDGLVSDDNTNILTGTKLFNNSGSGYTKINTGLSSILAGFSNTVWGGDAGYVLADKAGSTSTGYCDFGYLSSNRIAYFGGHRSEDNLAGAFCVRLDTGEAGSSKHTARLCYKNENGIYVGNYLGYVEGTKLRSISGKEPTGDKTIGQFRTYAQNNNN